MENGFESFISRFISLKKFIRLSEKGYPDKAVEMKSLEDGSIERRELHVQPIAACGRVLSENSISGICSMCGLFECSEPGHFSLCMECKLSLCVVCSYPVRTDAGILYFCSRCYGRALLNQDTWAFPLLPMRGRHEQRRLEDKPEQT